MKKTIFIVLASALFSIASVYITTNENKPSGLVSKKKECRTE